MAVDKSNYTYETETIDKVYILSESEYVKYLENKPSTWKDDTASSVWVRSKGNKDTQSLTIRYDGYHQPLASGYPSGIRPVIWVKYSTPPTK